MGKYNWNIYTLIERIKLIEQLLLHENDPKKLVLLENDYSTIYDYINDYFEQSPAKITNLLDNYKCVKENLNSMRFLWKEFEFFSKNVDVPFININIKRNNLSKKDLLELTHDFYKSLNKYFYNYFMKNFIYRKNHIVFKRKNNKLPYAGETIAIPSLNESFIEIIRSYTLDDVLTTIHEYSHATSNLINPYHFEDSKNLYYETDALFMELLAIDFLKKIFNEKIPTMLKISRLKDFHFYSNDIVDKISLIIVEEKLKNGYINDKVLKYIANKECCINSVEIDYLFGSSKNYEPNYLNSYIFAIELYHMYKNDKEKSLDYLKKIILLKKLSKKEYYNSIKRIGIIPNLNLQEFCNDCKKDFLKLTKKKTKFTK